MVDPRLRTALLAWARHSGRHLPTPARSDPWAVMVLEVASQQTQIVRSIEAADRFVARFPTPAALAAATPADAIREWAGLGYYRRAVKLREAAIKIVVEHGGEVPRRLEELAALPGIGPYTSRAIAVHAFGMPVAPLDTNVRRVARRFFGTDADIQANADGLVGLEEPARVVRALMDLATLVCRPKAPDCSGCPLVAGCASAFAGPPAKIDRPKGTPTRFVGSRRWLRGRLLGRLSAVTVGEWLPVEGLAADLPDANVADALSRMAADGLVEMADGRVRLSTTR